MNVDARLYELRPRFLKIEFRFADFHAGPFGASENPGSGFDLKLGPENRCLHRGDFRGHIAAGVARRANRIAGRAEHPVVRLFDFMVLVAGHATGETEILKRLRVRALRKEIAFLAMTLSAHRRNRIHSRRPRAMVAVTAIAGRRSEIMTLEQRDAM